MRTKLICSVSALLLLAGCASVPTGPDVMALPGQGRNFNEFRADDMDCRNFAYQQIGGAAREQATANAEVGNAVLGTVIGAVAGAAIGGGHRGAGVGAGTGLLIGSTAAANTSYASLRGSQRQYDMAYVQCMYAKGHRVPVNGVYGPAPAPVSPPPIPPAPAATASPGTPPPPPPGTPPPPPPTR